MHMLLLFAIYIYALVHGLQLTTGQLVIMVIYALFSDLLLYSLASQWVSRPNVSRPVIRNTHNIDPGIYKDSDAYNQIKKMDIERTIKHPTDDPFERPGK